MAPEARGTSEASRRAENTLTGHTRLFLLLGKASSRSAGIARVFLRLCVLSVACFSSKQCPSKSQRYAGFDHCHAFHGLGLPPLVGSLGPRRSRASRPSRASCPSRPSAFLPLVIRGLSGRPLCASPWAPCPSRAFAPSWAHCPSRASCPSRALSSLSSGLLLVLKFSSPFRAVCSMFSDYLFVRFRAQLSGLFRATCSFFSNSLVLFERFAPGSQIL